MRFTARMNIRVPVERLWEHLWQPERIAQLLPGCRELHEAEPRRRYRAFVVEQVGPFKVEFDMEVVVVESTPPQSARGTVSGTEKKLASTMHGGFSVKLSAIGPSESELVFDTDINILGRLGSLAGGPMKRKFEEMFARFEESLRTSLEAA